MKTLVSVLDLDNVIVGDPCGSPAISFTRIWPTTLIISLNDVKRFPREPRPTGRDRTKKVLSDHVDLLVCIGGAYRIRTDDILLAKQALYQLS